MTRRIKKAQLICRRRYLSDRGIAALPKGSIMFHAFGSARHQNLNRLQLADVAQRL